MRKQPMPLWATFATAMGVAFLFSGASRASDLDDVKAAVDGYHAAIASLDVARIEAFWVHDETVVDKEPRAKTITIGWDGTKKNFAGLTAAFAELAITEFDGPHVTVQGDIAWASGMNKAEGKLKKGGSTTSNVADSDVFKKQDGHWLLISHIATVMPE